MEKKLLKDIFIYQMIVMIVLGVVLFFINRNFSLGFFIGSVLATLNFIALIFVITKIFLGEPKTQLIYGFLFLIKLSLLGGIVFWLFKTTLFKLNILGFITGISTLFIVITLGSVLSKKEPIDNENENVNIGVI